MPAKRKRDILDFDPNQSDPEDENFELTEERPRRPAKKTARSSRPKGSSRKKRTKYSGSDVDDDDEELSDSQLEDSFAEGSDDEDEEEVDVPVNAAGRRARKVTTRPQNYKEDSDEDVIEDSDIDNDDAETRPKKAEKKQTKIVVLKTTVQGIRSTRNNKGSVKEESLPPVGVGRRTRARTEDAEDEFVELTGSGKHAQPTRAGSKSKSPEAMTRLTRNTRAAKGLKKPPMPPTIDEATQESSQPAADQDDLGALIQTDLVDEGAAQDEELVQDEDAEDELAGDGDAPMEGADNEAAQEEQDEDDMPINRRATRSGRAISGPTPAADEADDEGDKDHPKRSGRLLRQRSSQQSKKNNGADQSSDFEPGHDESGEGEPSEPSEKDGDDDEDEEYSSSRPSRGRRKPQAKGKKRRRRQESGDEEDHLDPDELLEEAEELRQSSRSRTRPRRARRQSTPIAYEQPSKRRRTAPVDYTIKPLDQMVIDQEEEDPVPTPARVRKGRNGGGTAYDRNFHTTFGPFGGGSSLGAILDGPWGTGVANAAADSDSSDDEMGQRSGVGGAVGMTPTTAAPPGLFSNPAAAVNLEALTGVSTGPNVGKVKNQKAFADADPLGVDMSVDFSKVGGLQGHIDQLKEMVQLPLLYPELFQRFHVTPPRGVLFHGPPGTGKTLLARALANSIGSGGRKITFYMRKGADALSKWVGEAEKQLRLLFEEARKTQPSIIFFDEIDGLAPVRSSKQEQIHASIVSTLLALMDGMDGRGQVIVIGATNRPDNIDPALRRPGRFDREFYFPLPDIDARKSIIDIHTKDWDLAEDFKTSLADSTKGYGGADLRALCTEAALNAIQRTYPQIYSAPDKLIVDPTKIDIHASDFMISIKKMIPSSERSASSGAAPLPKVVEPLLRDQFSAIEQTLRRILPRKKKTTALEEAMFEPYEDSDHGFEREKMQQDFERSRVFRPRLLITGLPGMGQGYLSSAILHHFEGVHVQNFDLASLLGDGRPLEQVIVSMFSEVKRHKPSVIYIPNVEAWWATLSDIALMTFTTMLTSIPTTDQVLLLGTAECEVDDLDKVLLQKLFGIASKNRIAIERPNSENRSEYFTNVVSLIKKTPAEFPDPSNRKKRVLEELPVAPPPLPKPQTKAETKAEEKRDRQMLNILKIKLQPIMDQIKKKYKTFIKPPIAWATLDYLWAEADPKFVRADVVDAVGPTRPFEHARDKDGSPGLRDVASGKFWYNLDIVTIEERLSNGYYARPMDFFKDIKALVHDAKNSGDREKILKANELESNVEVDVAEAEANVGGPDIWDALYQRQKARADKAAEKAKKRAAMERVIGLVLPEAGQDSDSQVGPIRIGAPVPPPDTTTRSHFRPITPEPNGHASGAQHLSNGDITPTPSRRLLEEDAAVETQPFPQMGPPPPVQWPSGIQGLRPLGESTRATTGGTTQISQVSALTSLPPGISPSAVLNDASTTKTSDASTHRGSLTNWSNQATNGYHGDLSNSQLPDTQPMDRPSGRSQDTASSHSPWIHSQAHAIERGELQPSMGSMGFAGHNMQVSPTSSQIPPERHASKSHAPSVADLLNDPISDTSSSVRNSEQSTGSSQHLVINDGQVQNFLTDLTDRTSGCTIEQLEQINRELMDEVWHTRHEWNRMKVLGHLRKVFNDTICDIETMQTLGQSSQEERDTAMARGGYR